MPRKSKGIIMYLAMFGLLIVLLFAMMSMDKPVSTMKYYEVLDYFKQGGNIKRTQQKPRTHMTTAI